MWLSTSFVAILMKAFHGSLVGIFLVDRFQMCLTENLKSTYLKLGTKLWFCCIRQLRCQPTELLLRNDKFLLQHIGGNCNSTVTIIHHTVTIRPVFSLLDAPRLFFCFQPRLMYRRLFPICELYISSSPIIYQSDFSLSYQPLIAEKITMMCFIAN